MTKKIVIYFLAVLATSVAFGQSKNQRLATSFAEVSGFGGISYDYQIHPYFGTEALFAMPNHQKILYGFEVTGTIGDQTVAPSLMGVLAFRTGGEFFGEFSLRGGVAGILSGYTLENTLWTNRSEAVYLLPSAGVTLKAGCHLGSWVVLGGVGVDYRFGANAQKAPEIDGLTCTAEDHTPLMAVAFVGAAYDFKSNVRHCGDHPWRLALGYGISNQGNLISAEVLKYNRVSAHWGRNVGFEFSETFGEVYTKSMGLLKLSYQYQLFGADTWLIPSASLGLGIGEAKSEADFTREDFTSTKRVLKPGVAGQAELKLELNLKKLFGVEGVALWAKAQASYVQPFPTVFKDCGETHESFSDQLTKAVVVGGTIAF